MATTDTETQFETKVSLDSSKIGEMGERYLASGRSMGLRIWEDEEPGDQKPVRRRDYETVGYCLRGRAELHIHGEIIDLRPGDSWVVPRGAEHTYRILETFTAIEATSPPAQVEDVLAEAT